MGGALCEATAKGEGWLMRCHRCFIGMLLLLPAWAPRAVAQVRADAESSFPIAIRSVDVIGRESDMGQPISGVVAPDGSVYIGDYFNAEVLRFSPEGELIWRKGRRGGGPGEYRAVYRLGLTPDGQLLVYDMGTQEVTYLTPEGEFVRRVRLPIDAQMSSIVALANGDYATSGVTVTCSPAAGSGVHLFDPDWNYRRSFGPLPPARDQRTRVLWGPGWVRLTANGDLLYTRKLPYQIYRFGPDGVLKQLIEAPFESTSGPDDAYVFRELSIKLSDIDVIYPLAAIELPPVGWILGGRIGTTESRKIWDVFSADGTLLGSREIPEDWRSVIGYDPDRNALWLTGRQDGVPVLLRLTIELSAVPAAH